MYFTEKERPEYASLWARPIDDLYDNRTMPATSQPKPVKKRAVLEKKVMRLFDPNSI